MSPELAERLRLSTVELRGGSGVIWTRDGIVVTNAHVLVGTRSPDVRLSDGRSFEAEVVREDRRRDLAVLRIRGQGLTAAEIGDSSRLRAGQMVAAVGNPLGLKGAISTGIIHSAGAGEWIEADVRLAPGNSGGMLADASGRVVGINTMVMGGLALAVPSNRAAAFVRGDSPDRPLLGITMRPVTVRNQRGLAVLEVEPGSLAARAGLMLGDVLLMTEAELRAGLDARGTLLMRYLRGNDLGQTAVTT